MHPRVIKPSCLLLLLISMAICTASAQARFSLPANPLAANIAKMEYFVDIDPGFGNGTIVPITAAANVSTNTATLLPNNISKGLHYLYFRSQDANGSWSLPKVQTINIFNFLSALPQNTSPQNITALEYFIDADPGFGKATNISIGSGTDVSGNVAISLSGLSKGAHKIFARAKDSNGKWSVCSQQNVFILNFAGSFPTNASPKAITNLEYFLDVDPGLGNATAIPIAAGIDVTASNIAVPIGTLSNGMHKLYTRVKNASGSWSLINITPLYIAKLAGSLGANAVPANITAMEYFLDADPGFGKATPISVASGMDVTANNIVVPTASLSKGIHQLFVRSKNANGVWSISTADVFNVFSLMGALPGNANPSAITALEYFIDTDPGFGKATQAAINVGTDITANNVAVSISALSTGVHNLYARTKTASGWSLSGFSSFFIVKPIGILPKNTTPNSIAALEYFFDTDPGFGKANAVAVSAANDISSNVVIPLTGLKNGIHKLVFRSKDANGNWSVSNLQSLLIYSVLNSLPSSANPANITALEYFIDTDPGFGNATAVPITAATDVTASNITVPVSGLSNGLHRLFVRSKNANGVWSLTSTPPFYTAKLIGNLAANAAPASIVAMEYFIDADPGFNKATPISVAAGTDVLAANVPIPLGNLPNGLHRLFIRSQDAAGRWSITNIQTLLVYVPIGQLPVNTTPRNIAAMEYFMDSDPGLGKAIAIPITNGSDVSGSMVVDISNLSKGLHHLFVRSKDDAGHWSIMSTQNINIFSILNSLPNNANPSVITAMEYFMDTDPGFGNGTAIPIAAGTDVTASNVAVPLANNLSAGIHRLFVRTKNANGNWSLANLSQFFLAKTIGNLPQNQSATNVAAMEYFVDADPGFGLATPIAITAATDVTAANYAVSLGNLPVGFHRIYVRSKADNGLWSLTNKQNIFVMGNISLPNNPVAAAITKLEYFVDTDPGFGNATQVNVPATTDLSKFNFDVSLGNIANGKHYLFVRTYDTWGLTNVVPFVVGNSLPVTWLGFTATLIDNNAVSLNWQTANEVNNKYFVVERSADGLQFDSIGMVAAKNVQGITSDYNLIDHKPLTGISYYRIKQVDKDGKSTYSVIVAVRISGFSDIQVSPNPFRDALTVQLSATQQSETTLKLMDASGKYLFTKSVGIMVGTNTLHLDGLGKLAAGSYILIVNNKSETATIKLIKE